MLDAPVRAAPSASSSPLEPPPRRSAISTSPQAFRRPMSSSRSTPHVSNASRAGGALRARQARRPRASGAEREERREQAPAPATVPSDPNRRRPRFFAAPPRSARTRGCTPVRPRSPRRWTFPLRRSRPVRRLLPTRRAPADVVVLARLSDAPCPVQVARGAGHRWQRLFSSATVMYSYSRYIANHAGIEPPTWLSETSYTCCSVTYVPLISSTTAPGGATNTSNSKWSSGTKPVNRFLPRDKRASF